jgi:hypothetical protein
VRWYLRYGLSYGDVEELLVERGIEVDHVTIHRWVQRFTPLLIDAARPCRHSVGGRWLIDETYVKVAGRWRYVYRAIDQHGQVIDVFVSPRRDLRAARTFLRRSLLGPNGNIKGPWKDTGPGVASSRGPFPLVRTPRPSFRSLQASSDVQRPNRVGGATTTA